MQEIKLLRKNFMYVYIYVAKNCAKNAKSK